MTPLVSGGTGAIALRLAFTLFLNVVLTHHTLGYIRGAPAISVDSVVARAGKVKF
jgi:hypothetical protein